MSARHISGKLLGIGDAPMPNLRISISLVGEDGRPCQAIDAVDPEHPVVGGMIVVVTNAAGSLPDADEAGALYLVPNDRLDRVTRYQFHVGKIGLGGFSAAVPSGSGSISLAYIMALSKPIAPAEISALTEYMDATNQRLDALEAGDVGSGDPGASAYQVAVANGFVGDQAAWLASLQGATGAGFLNIPTSNKSADYTTVIGDAGKGFCHPATDNEVRTFTIDGSLAYDDGTAFTFFNESASNLIIAVTTQTMRLAGVGTTGTRSLMPYGIAVVVKQPSGGWLASGPGLI